MAAVQGSLPETRQAATDSIAAIESDHLAAILSFPVTGPSDQPVLAFSRSRLSGAPEGDLCHEG